jgi:hypothetical protein
MENITPNNLEPNQPLGTLFNTINYSSLEHLEKFISEINHEQALYCIIQGVQAAYQRNSFTMIESEVISKAIRKISNPNIVKDATTE